MKIAACQVPDVRDDLAEALSIIEEMTVQAESQDADLVLFPECFLQGYFTDFDNVSRLAIALDSDRFDKLLVRLRDFRCVIVFGLIEKSIDGFHNTAVAIQSGEIICRYRKSQLLDGERAVFVAGSDYSIFEVAGQKVGINICYDLNFRTAIEAVARQEAKILVCPCNNMMPTAKAEKFKLLHNQIRAQQCLEVGVWVVSSDVMGVRGERISYGPTAVINPDGAVIAQVPLMTNGLVVVDIE